MCQTYSETVLFHFQPALSGKFVIYLTVELPECNHGNCGVLPALLPGDRLNSKLVHLLRFSHVRVEKRVRDTSYDAIIPPQN